MMGVVGMIWGCTPYLSLWLYIAPYADFYTNTPSLIVSFLFIYLFIFSVFFTPEKNLCAYFCVLVLFLQV